MKVLMTTTVRYIYIPIAVIATALLLLVVLLYGQTQKANAATFNSITADLSCGVEVTDVCNQSCVLNGVLSHSYADTNYSYIDQAWRGAHFAWDDDAQFNYSYTKVGYAPDTGLAWTEHSQDINHRGWVCSCGSAGGCAGQDWKPGFPFFSQARSGLPGIDSVSWDFNVIQKRNVDINAMGGDVSFAVVIGTCDPGERTAFPMASQGDCVPVTAVTSVTTASSPCTTPCNVTITWTSNSLGTIDVLRTGPSNLTSARTAAAGLPTRYTGPPLSETFTQTLNTAGTYDYSFLCNDGTGANTACGTAAQVVVSSTVACNIQTLTINGSVSPPAVSDPGTANVAWTTVGATTVSVSRSPSGPTSSALNGSLTDSGLTPGTYNYTVNCTAPGGNDNQTISIDVTNSCPAVSVTGIQGYSIARGYTAQVYTDDTHLILYGSGFSNSGNTVQVDGIGRTLTGETSVQVNTLGTYTAGSHNGVLTTVGCGNDVFSFNAVAPPSCTYGLSPSSASVGVGGGTGSFSVTTQGGCVWTAVSNIGWITVTAGASGIGSSAVSYSVSANGGAARSGTITAGGQTFVINQAGSVPCTYTHSPSSASFTTAGGASSFQVLTQAGCAWNATTPNAWVTITSAVSGTGNGTIDYTVAVNAGASRGGYINVGGINFPINQAGVGCSYSLSPTSFLPTAAAGSSTFAVNTQAGCAWTAVANNAWLSITAGSSGTGTGNVTFAYTANAGAARGGTITAGGQTFNVAQAAAGAIPPLLSYNPLNFTFSATQGGSNPAGQILGITNNAPVGGGNLGWSVSDNAAWLTVQRLTCNTCETSGTESANGGTATPPLDVTVDITGLTAGPYSANITLTTNGGNAIIPVTLTIAAGAPTAPNLSFVSSSCIGNSPSITLRYSGNQPPAVNSIRLYKNGNAVPILTDNTPTYTPGSEIYTDSTGLTSGLTYTYTADALNGGGTGPATAGIPVVAPNCAPTPNVSVAITAIVGSGCSAPSNIHSGCRLTFQVRYQNIGGGPASSVLSLNDLSQNLKYQSGSFSCQFITCSLISGTSGNVTFQTTAPLNAGAQFFAYFDATVQTTTQSSRELATVRVHGQFNPGAAPFDLTYSLITSPSFLITPKIYEVAP